MRLIARTGIIYNFFLIERIHTFQSVNVVVKKPLECALNRYPHGTC